ncbi:MAG: GntR family transcriptional regulator [Calditrichaeota bacterium]|nr:GntR family transcriptional regulator [Calditrichota bacterium]
MKIDLTDPKPLYLQIAENIRSAIRTGKLQVGQQLPSQSQMMKIYDVSSITVKKAISELVREGLVISRTGKGTFVARKSGFMDLSKHKTIGLVLSDLTSPFFSLIMKSIESETSENGYNLMVSNSSERRDKEENLINHFKRIGVDGLVIASLSHQYRATSSIRKLAEEKFPFIMVSYIEDEDIPFVGTDHEAGACMATEHLIKLGYKKIGYINAEEGNLLGQIREKAFRHTLKKHGIPINENYIEKFPFKMKDYESGHKLGKQFFTKPDRPRALFIYNDLSALGFQQAVLEQGYKIPEDVAIIGFDNIEQGKYSPVPLTTIHQPTDLIGQIAYQNLIAAIENRNFQIRTILKPELIIRKSCATY